MSELAQTLSRRLFSSRPWVGPGFLVGAGYHEGSVLANRLGLQLARTFAMNANFRLRRRPVDEDLAPHVATFERDGIVVLPDFLPADVFAAAQAEYRAAWDASLYKSECVEDNSVIEESLSVAKNRDRLPVLWEHLGENEFLMRLAAALLRRSSISGMSLVVSVMRKSEDAPPPSRLVGTNYIHSDVHYPTAKAWLYLDDIDEENGAFVYAKGSQKLSFARLAYEYEASVRVARAKRNGAVHATIPYGRVRMPTEAQLRAMGVEETPIRGRANTLIVASTMGFHRRGEFEEGRSRDQVMIKFGDRPKKTDKPAG